MQIELSSLKKCTAFIITWSVFLLAGVSYALYYFIRLSVYRCIRINLTKECRGLEQCSVFFSLLRHYYLFGYERVVAETKYSAYLSSVHTIEILKKF